MTPKRMLIYSHDSFGLGHMRRCRSIALSLVEAHPALSTVILSGLPFLNPGEIHPRIEFRSIPGIVKLKTGEYRAVQPQQSLAEAIVARAALIREIALAFDPDLFLVDKEPLGIRGEVRPTLELLRGRGAAIILGLRDIMDDPARLRQEWQRKRAVAALEAFYDEIWIYGLRQIYDPLAGIDLPEAVRRRIVFTSYLRRSVAPAEATALPGVERPFLLVTPGGGGDGDGLVDWVLKACESGQGPAMNLLIVCGPFMDAETREGFERRTACLPGVSIATFVRGMESLMASAAGVVAMGGYNTFCEILSFDKPALVVPRTVPRLEQCIRASRASELGLVAMLPETVERDPAEMAAALARLTAQHPPSTVEVPGLFDGHAVVARRVAHWLGAGQALPMDVAI
jgi:predicted glycosyltransferase